MAEYKQVIIVRKDLNMSSGKIAAQVAHAALAFLNAFIKSNTYVHVENRHECYCRVTGRPQKYLWSKLNKLAIEARQQGKKYFYTKRTGFDEIEFTDEPEVSYFIIPHAEVDKGIYENWMKGSFTKIICGAKNKNQLLKVIKIAKSLGLEEDKDFFLIRDNCYTELTPEDEDGKTLTCIGFRPLPVELSEQLSKKYQLL